MKEEKVWEIYFTDSRYDDYTDTLAIFKGTLDEAVRYTKALIYDHLVNEEAPESIEYVSLNDLTYDGEVGNIQRPDSHRAFWIKRHVDQNIVTIKDIDREGEDLLDKFPNGIDEENKKDFLRTV